VAGYDQRGTGASSGNMPPDSSRLAADHASAVGRSVLGPRFHVVGESLGGMAALRLATEAPELVASLVLICTSAGGRGLTPPTPEFLANLTGQGASEPRERARENLALSFGPRFPVDHAGIFEALIDRMLTQPGSPDALGAQAQTFATHDVTEELGSLRVPTLVMCGTEDKVMPPPNSVFLADNVPGATLQLIEGAGHAVDLEAAGRLVAAISTHVAAHPVGPLSEATRGA
jgi:pimeloyl-ACP methyl ester carboxylesterase